MKRNSITTKVVIAATATCLNFNIAQSMDARKMDIMYGQQCIRETLNENLCNCIIGLANTRFSDLIEREIFLDMVVGGVHPAKNQLAPMIRSSKDFLSRLAPADHAVTNCKRNN